MTSRWADSRPHTPNGPLGGITQPAFGMSRRKWQMNLVFVTLVYNFRFV